VYQNTGSNFLTTLGLTGTNLPPPSNIDVSAKYIYMYQAYASVGPIEQLQILASPGLFTSAGFLPNTVFVDSQGAVGGSTSNKALGSEPNVDDPTIDGNPATVNSGSNHSGFKNQTLLAFGVNNNAIAPNGADLSADSGFVVFNFTGSNKISTGKTSVVVFLTSNFGPEYNEGQIHDGGVSNGDVPTAVTPEPGSLVLCGLGVSFLGFYGWRRRGLNAQLAMA
jgi:hypothetical protein